MERNRRTGRGELVLEANVEGRIGMGCECHSCLASDIFWSSVLIAYCILDLNVASGQSKHAQDDCSGCTHVHVDCLPVSLRPTDDSCDKHKGISGYKVSDTSLVFVGVAGMRLKVELEGRGQGEEGKSEDAQRD